MYKRILFLTLLFFFFLPAGLICKEPNSTQVKTELNKILEQMGVKKHTQFDPDDSNKRNLFEEIARFLSTVIQGIIRFFERLGPMFLILIIAGFLFLIFLLLRKIIPGFRKDKLPGSTQPVDPVTKPEDLHPASPAALYREALAAAARGDYNRAVELLHKASVAVLWEEEILSRGQDYTNNEIRSLLSGGYYTAFHTITSSAERITFRYDTVDETQYYRLLEDYRNCFNRGSL